MTIERKKILSGIYTHVVIIPREAISKNGFPFTRYQIRINDFIIPYLINNIKFTHDCVTVFDFSGTLFVGSDHKAEVVFFEYPNGVIQVEITVI